MRLKSTCLHQGRSHALNHTETQEHRRYATHGGTHMPRAHLVKSHTEFPDCGMLRFSGGGGYKGSSMAARIQSIPMLNPSRPENSREG